MGEQELEGTSYTDVDEEPQSIFIRDEESCCCDEEPTWIWIWAWTSLEPRVRCYNYWVWPPWEWSEETGECYAYD